MIAAHPRSLGLLVLLVLAAGCGHRAPRIPPDAIALAPVECEASRNYNPVYQEEGEPARVSNVSRMERFCAFLYHPTVGGGAVRMSLRRTTPDGPGRDCGTLDARTAAGAGASGGDMGPAETLAFEVCSGAREGCFPGCADEEGYFLAGTYTLSFEIPGQTIAGVSTEEIVLR